MSRKIDLTPYVFPHDAFAPGMLVRFVYPNPDRPEPGDRWYADKRYYVQGVRHWLGSWELWGHVINPGGPSLCGHIRQRPDGTWTYFSAGAIKWKPRVIPTEEFSAPIEPAPVMTVHA